MQVTMTDLGEEYSCNGQTVSFEGEQHCGDVFVNDTLLGEYERDSKGDCYFINASTGKRRRIGQTEEDFERFAYWECRKAELGVK